MQLSQTILFLLTLFILGHAIALPTSFESLNEASRSLFKRKGGGGGGGRGGGGGGGRGGGGGGGRSSSSSSSSRGGSNSGSSSSGRTSTTSNTGGQTSRGSGVSPSYGGNRFYGGGATVPYSAGAPRSGFRGAPLLLGAGAIGLGAYGALWFYGAYAYPYYHSWSYRNTTNGQNETHPAQCWCSRYQSCSCEDNNSTEYINSVANDPKVARVVNLNGTDTLVVNGTLENGTTAAGGSDSAAGSLKMSHMVGYWPVVAGVAYAVMAL